MSTAYNRSTAIVGKPCTLTKEFFVNKIPYSPYQVRLVEIYDSNPETGTPTALASYTPTEESTGVYTIDTEDILTKVNTLHFDKWYFIWKLGETEADTTGDFYVARENALNIIGELRTMLKDTHPQVSRRRWTDQELELAIDNALLDINVQPPAFTDYTLDDWETYVPYWKGLIVQGGMMFALIQEGIFQIGIEFNYSDQGIAINTDKSGKYQSMANMMLQNYQMKKEQMKKQFWFQNSKPRSLITNPLPFSVRIMSSRQARSR